MENKPIVVSYQLFNSQNSKFPLVSFNGLNQVQFEYIDTPKKSATGNIHGLLRRLKDLKID